MKIEIIPKHLTIDPDILVGESESMKIRVRVVRGPLTWISPTIYTLDSETTQIDFKKEELFEKESGFYFSGNEAEFKKAVIEIVRVENESDLEGLTLSEATLNLSSLISFDLLHEKLDINEKGI